MVAPRPELWRRIKGYEKYEVSSLGRVRNTVTGHVLTPMWTGQKRKQYATVRFSTVPRIDMKVHRLVLQAFVGPCPHGYIGCHRDDDTTNNSIANLFWGTLSDNARMASQPSNKLSNLQKLEIRRRRANGERGAILAREYGVSQQLICDAYNNRTGWE